LAQKLDAQRLCVASGWLHCFDCILLTAALPFIPAGDPVTAKWVFIVGFSIILVAKANWILLFGQLGAAVAFPAWGKLSDKYGKSPRPLLHSLSGRRSA